MPKPRAASAQTTPKARKSSTHTTVKKVTRPRPARTPAAAVLDPADHHAAIAKLAYRNWQMRGDNPGSPEDDWLRAENEFRTSQRAL